MRRATLGGLAAAVGLLLAIEIRAEVYQWTDDEGVLHFSDNPPAVPATVRDEGTHGGNGTFSAAKTLDVPLPKRGVRHPWLDGASGYERALRLQARSDSPLLVYFRTDWCPHCRRLDEMLADGAVRKALQSYLKVRINPEAGDAEEGIFREYGGSAFPSVYLHPVRGAPPKKLAHGGPAEAFLRRLESRGASAER